MQNKFLKKSRPAEHTIAARLSSLARGMLPASAGPNTDHAALGAATRAASLALELQASRLELQAARDQLLCALYDGDMETLRLIFTEPHSGTNFFFPRSDHPSAMTPLHLACAMGNAYAVEQLLLAKADAGCPGRQGSTPLLTACYSGQQSCAALLLAHNGSPNEGGPHCSPLVAASIVGSVDCVRTLIEARADVRPRHLGWTALQAAELWERADCLSLLLDAEREAEAKRRSIVVASLEVAHRPSPSGAAMRRLSKVIDSKGSSISLACGSSHTLLATAGELYTWGGGMDDCIDETSFTAHLGHGRLRGEAVLSPTRVDGLQAIVVCQVAAGRAHSLLLTDLGRAFSWGNGASGQLGQPYSLWEQTDEALSLAFPTPIDCYCTHAEMRVPISSVAQKFAHIAAGELHSVLISADGDVYTCGHGGHGRLGLGKTRDPVYPFEEESDDPFSAFRMHEFDRAFPTRVSLIRGNTRQHEGIERDAWAAAAGDCFTIVLTRSGLVFAFGDHSVGQCGVGDILLDESQGFSLAGWELHGILRGCAMSDSKASEVFLPVCIPNLRRTVQVSAKGQHVLAIDCTGAVHSWGCNEYGQCGFESSTSTPPIADAFSFRLSLLPTRKVDKRFESTPRRIDQLLPYGKAVSVTAGGRRERGHSCVVMKDGRVLTFGFGDDGQLGHGHEPLHIRPLRYTPRIVEALSGTKVVQAAAGDDFTVVLGIRGGSESSVIFAFGSGYNGQLGNRQVFDGSPMSNAGPGARADSLIYCTVDSSFAKSVLPVEVDPTSTADPPDPGQAVDWHLFNHACTDILTSCESGDPQLLSTILSVMLQAKRWTGRCMRLRAAQRPVLFSRCRRALLAACFHGHVECVSMLLSHGITPDTVAQQEDCTALIAASIMGHTSCVRTLIEARADLDRSFAGQTALHAAQDWQRADCVQLLHNETRASLRSEQLAQAQVKAEQDAIAQVGAKAQAEFERQSAAADEAARALLAEERDEKENQRVRKVTSNLTLAQSSSSHTSTSTQPYSNATHTQARKERKKKAKKSKKPATPLSEGSSSATQAAVPPEGCADAGNVAANATTVEEVEEVCEPPGATAADEQVPAGAPPAEPSSASSAGSSIPEAFLCPITTELMHDPVSTVDGLTYGMLPPSLPRSDESALVLLVHGPLPLPLLTLGHGPLPLLPNWQSGPRSRSGSHCASRRH